jgi:NAD(P)-dependent dehydrogenase (short-subunit alcohol dehydrogenase family)
MMQTIIDRFGRLDFACNAAGIGGKLASTADTTEDDFDFTLAINLRGVWFCMKYQIRQMLKQGSGSDCEYLIHQWFGWHSECSHLLSKQERGDQFNQICCA